MSSNSMRIGSKRNGDQDQKGKGIAKQKPQVIDLCDSSDESPPRATQETRPNKKARHTEALPRAIPRSNPYSASSSSTATRPMPPHSSSPTIISPPPPTTNPYANDHARKPAQDRRKPPAPRSETPPLFRYRDSSPEDSPCRSTAPLASPARKRSHPPDPPPITLGPAATVATTVEPTSNSKKQKILHVITLDDSDSEPEVVPTLPRQPPPPPAEMNTVVAQKDTTTTKALLQEFAEYSEDSSLSSDSELEILPTASKAIFKGKGKEPAPNPGGMTAAPAPAAAKRKIGNATTVELDSDSDEDDELLSERPTSKKSRLSESEKAQRAAEKEEARWLKQREREEKAAKKEEEKAAKKTDKEVKEREKKFEQELLSINKLRTSKKDSTPEMIVDIGLDLASHPLGIQLRRFLAGLGCEVNHEWSPNQTFGNIGLWMAVKWRRKVKAEYNEERGMFLPLPTEEIRDEPHILFYMQAKEFLEISVDGDVDHLAMHVESIKAIHPTKGEGVRLIYLIEGLDALVRKNKNNRNKQYQNRVRAQLGVAGAGSSASDLNLIDEDQVEDARLRLQIEFGCLIHETRNMTESAEWISKFTGEISTIPYKKSRMVSDTAFCTDIGQVKTGIGRADTYSRMLEEIHRVTPSVVNGIASEYPDVQSLVGAFRLHGEDAIANLPNIATRGGLPMSRNIGVALSRRVCSIFMGTDPFDTDV